MLTPEEQHAVAADEGDDKDRRILELMEENLALHARVATMSGFIPQMMDLQHKNITLIHQMGESCE